MSAIRLTLAALAVIAVATGIAACYSNEAAALPPPPPQGYYPLPDGFDFPASQASLEHYVNTQDRAAYRRHGWYLFAGLNQQRNVSGVPGLQKLPVWQTWFSVSQAFASRAPTAPAYRRMVDMAAATPSGRATPTLQRLTSGTFPTLTVAADFRGQIPNYPGSDVPDGVLFANNGDIMIAGEYYNWQALKHLRGAGLFAQSKLQAMLRQGNKSVPEFPREAVVLKTMYWPVAQDRLTALPVWDNAPHRAPYDYNGYETWPRAVAIDARRAVIPAGETARVSTLFGVKVPGFDTPRTFADAKVVSVRDFVHLRIDAALWKAMDQPDKVLLNNAARWAYGREFKPGDYLVLVAMHINTKEIPPWAMQTFWWHDPPNVGPFSENRPDGLLTGALKHYRMSSAYSQVVPREYDGSNHVAYNPYVELVIHPIPTNCQNCHARAAWPTQNKQNPRGARYVDTPAGRREVKPSDPYFNGLLRADYLWTIPDRAIRNAAGTN